MVNRGFFSYLWLWLLDADWKTWVSHGIIGFGLTAVFGWQFTFGAFLYREASDLINWWANPDPVMPEGSSYGKRPFQDKLKDGFFDLWSPLAGAALALILFQ